MKRALSPTDANPAPPAKRLKLSTSTADTTSIDNNNANASPNNNAAPRSDTSPFFKGSSQPSQSPFKPKSFNLSYSSTPLKKLGNISLQTSSGQSQSAPDKVANQPKNTSVINSDTKKSSNSNGASDHDIDEQVKSIMQDITPDMLEDDYQPPPDPVPQPSPAPKKQADVKAANDSNGKMKQGKLDFSKAKPKPASPPTEVKTVSKVTPKATPKTAAPKTAAPKVDQRSDENDGEYESGDGEDEGDEKVLSKSGSRMLDKFHDMSVKERRRAQKQESWKQKNKHKYAFLEQIMDENKNLKGSPGYDPRTLYIPAQAYANMTPFEKQYWDIKRNHFDTVIFFKKGMFYELFETDAEIGHRELDLKMTDRVNMRMVGLPAKHFTHWAAKLIALGYKVAKVEQLETPLAMAKRQGVKGARDVKDVVLKRELTLIMTPATIVDESLLSTPQATYLLALKEDIERIHYGICLVDTATGEFKLGHFQDDKARTQLQTMLFQTRPREVVFEKSALSPVTMKLLRQQLSHVIFTPLNAKQCWDAQTTLDKLTFEPYFYQGTVTDYDKVKEDWPAVIKRLKDSTHAIAALGTCIAYLNELKLDQQLVSLKNFSEYNVLGETEHLILDGKSLFNLEIVENNHDLTAEGTLLHVIDDCRTAFGKRLLKQWLCHPLKDISAIDDRLNAVADLMAAVDLADNLRKNMKKLPDLQRTISRIHAGHVTLAEFVTVLDAFEHIHTFMTEIQKQAEEFSSVTLKHITKLGEGMPEFGDELQRICSSFDRTSAMTSGRINPNLGFAPEYDTAVSHVTDFEQQLTAHLKAQQAHFKSTKVTFKDIGKDLYLIEVPSELLQKVSKPNGYVPRGQTAKVQRFYTDTITEILPKLAEAKEELAAAEAGLLQTYLQAFDAHYTRWSRVLDCLAELDCLLSLASCSSKNNACRPQFIDPDTVTGPILDIENLRHPCLVESMPDTFIPNSIKLGSGEPLVVLLTGPNMGGKSTILRQTSIAVIMAQIGCYVFADKCIMTPVDRIFTRIGAQDHIFEGQSTFMVELIEAGLVLHQATQHSLVILDELGRGTSTFDGYSLAYAVLKFISEMIGCRTLFSTHYHMLTDEFKDNAAVALHHMKCITDPTLNKITFLYQMDRGVCPKSYGMNVAHMANLPLQVIQAAEIKAKTFEEASQLGHYKNYTRMKAQSIRLTASLQTLYEILNSDDDAKLKRLWQDLNERK